MAENEPNNTVERVARAIHEGLGGDGWAYISTRGNEQKHMRDELLDAARAAIEASDAAAWKARAEQAEAWLFDVVSGIAQNDLDWQAVAKQCALLEPKARAITEAVLSNENVERIAKASMAP